VRLNTIAIPEASKELLDLIWRGKRKEEDKRSRLAVCTEIGDVGVIGGEVVDEILIRGDRVGAGLGGHLHG